jgi:hypothetical protein
MTQVKWKFRGTDIYFVSDKDKLTRDVMRQRNRLKTNSKIEIINDLFTNTEPTDADSTGGDGNTTFKDLEALDSAINPDKSEEQKASGLRSVSDDVDVAGSASASLEDSVSNSNAGVTGNRVRRKRNR